jgi:HEAT repeat protein
MMPAQQKVAGLPSAAVDAPVVPPVITEHLLETAFLAIQRRKLLFASDVPLVSFPSHDERMAAHWDGLVVGAQASVDIALKRMEELDPWETYAAARVWIELGAPAAAEVIDRIEKTDPELHGSWREALRRIPRQRIAQLFPASSVPAGTNAVAAVVVYALGSHDLLPDNVAAAAAFNTDPPLRRSLARALGWSRSTTQAPALLATLAADPDADVRRAALWSIALAQPNVAATHARNRVRSGAADYFDLRVLGLLGVESDLNLLLPIASTAGENRNACIGALGALGSPLAVGTLIELAGLKDGAAALAAQESLVSIVGQLPGADAVAADDDEAPPPLDIPQLREWWASASASYPAGTRWLRGQPFPWSGAPEEEPMDALWRSLFHTPRPGFEWLRNEIPDGFLDVELRPDAVPGE